jgi:DNA-directed RNA polymerase specialized sigma24 family protein
MAQVRVESFDPLAPTPVVLQEAAATVDHMDQLEEQAHVERLQENREHAELIAKAVAVARQTGEFHGRAWEQLSDMLCEYAWKTLQSKIRTGEIAELVGKYTAWWSLHPGDAETLRVSPDARMELAGEVILRALPDFQRNALMAGRWDPEGGARLKTYFIGTCAFKFRRAYEHWARERRGKLHEAALNYGVNLVWVDQQIGTAVSDIAGDDPRLSSALELLERQDETTKMIYLLMMRDLTHAEIGEQLGLSASAVESRARRFRRLVKRQAVAA